MARRVAIVHIYDRKNEVCITAVVRRYSGLQQPVSTVELRLTLTPPSRGTAEAQDWLRDGLVQLLSSI